MGISWISINNKCYLYVNVGDSLSLQCSVNGGTTTALAAGVQQLFVITATAAITGVTITAGTATAAASATFTGGTLVWDTYNGPASSYSHFIVIQTLAHYTASFGRGWLSLFIPYMRSGDSGTYFCNYIDGSGTTVAAIGSSTQFIISMQTKSSSKKISTYYNNYLKYFALIVASTKMLF
jgi:hypothetical protein